MGEFAKELANKLYPWHIHVIGGLIVAGIALFIFYTFWGIRKYTDAFSKILGRDDRIKDLQERIDNEKKTRENCELIADQVTTSLFNIKTFIDTLNSIRLEEDLDEKTSESLNLIQRMLDQLSNDVKVRGGAQHRCGIWIVTEYDRNILKLQFTSSGFPRNYKGNRILEINDSLAGKTFNKKQKQNIKNVKEDKDWKPSPFTDEVRYKSLICIPLGSFGVLTIDGEEPMSEECELISEVYASLIEKAVIEHDDGYNKITIKKMMESIELQEDVG